MPAYFKKAQDPISSYTHFWGAIVSGIILLFYLLLGLFQKDDLKTIFSCSIFAISAIALYSASCYYHTLPLSHRNHTLFRKLDHSMIYVLIAGSYTPIVIHYLPSKQGGLFLFILWMIAVVGIVIKIFWMNAPRILSTFLYLIMGWAILFYFPAFYNTIETSCILLLALGGLSYTLGGIIYMVQKPNFCSAFGFHELFHCFILGGTLFHFIAVACFIL